MYNKVVGDDSVDRRQQKTRALIFNSFNALLKTKRYDRITVQQIIDGANVGRSTFYSHFETKDDLLYEMCTDIFGHVFAKEPIMCEKTHDFSDCDADLKTKLTHLLYHVKYSRSDISGILTCEGGEVFMKYFKEYLSQLFSDHIDDFTPNVRQDYLLNHLSVSFAETVKWWIKDKTQIPPEQLSEDFLSLIPKKV